MRLTIISLIIPILSIPAVLAANPSACLLSAVNEQPNPADLKTICDADTATKVQEDINNLCEAGANESAAQEAFVGTCSSAGVSVAMYTPTSTTSNDASGTASSGASSTAGETASGASASASGSGSSSSSAANAMRVGDVKAFLGSAVVVVGVLEMAVGL